MRLTAAVGVLPAVPAGPERLVTELLRATADLDPDLTITLHARTVRHRADALTAMRRIAPDARHSVTRLPGRTDGPWQRLPERLVAGRFDVYHQFHLDADPAVPSTRLVVGLNDLVALDWPTDEGPLGAHALPLLRRAARIVTLSEYSRDVAVDRLRLQPDRFTVVPLGVDHDVFTPGRDRPDGTALLYVGGATRRKNVDRIVAALHELRQDQATADARLVLAGPVARAEQQIRAAAPSGLPHESLVFAGHVSDRELAALYRSSSALVVPSLAEGFGLPVIEAMACGTPVVTSRTTSLPEVGGDAAVYVDPTDVGSIATGISEIVGAADDEREARRSAGIRRAAGFTWSAAGARVLDVYRGVTG